MLLIVFWQGFTTMSTNNKQLNIYKSRWEAVLELQILRFFTTLAILTIVFVLVLRFVQQTSVSSDKIKPPEAAMGSGSVETLFDFTQMKTLTPPELPVDSRYMERAIDSTISTKNSEIIKE